MTIALSLKVNDGVVLAADSASTLTGITPVGTVSVIDVYNNAVGAIDNAWAVDAAGVPVPRNYEVEGNVLRQVIHADESVTYPIVADPRIGAGLSLYLYLAFFKTLPSRLSTTYACSEVRWCLNKTTVKSVSSSLCTPISQSMQWK